MILVLSFEEIILVFSLEEIILVFGEITLSTLVVLGLSKILSTLSYLG